MKSSSHSGTPSLQVPATSSLQFPVAPTLLRVFAGSKEIDRSCGGDVEDEVVVELDDSPGTTKRNEVLGFAESLLPVLGQTWLATTGPLTSVTVLFAKLAKGQYGRSVLEQLQSDESFEDHARTLALLHSSGPPPLAVTTVMGVLDLLEYPTLLSSIPSFLTYA